ncbi:MAG: chorismate mutase [Ktedonobacteraceae bacterium]
MRGAITVDNNDREEILAATIELLSLMVRENNVRIEDIASASFTLTDDLDAVFPALAARQIGWNEVPLICMREIPVPNSLEKCIRVLLLVNTTCSASEIQHIYMREAVSLRPEFVPESKAGLVDHAFLVKEPNTLQNVV